MELYEEMTRKLMGNELHAQIAGELTQQINADLYGAMASIQAVLKDESNTDEDCFAKIEEIVCIYEEIGGGCGNCHDFG